MRFNFKITSFLLVFLLAGDFVFSQNFSYYFPQPTDFNSSVPKPKDVLGFEVGEFHATHDNLVTYFTQLAKASARVKYEVYGRTHEGRPLSLAIISSEANIKRIEEIRQEHLQLGDPSVSSKLNLTGMPVVVWLSHSIHGNEASGCNSSMLTAYYLAAGKGKEIEELLDNTVVLIDPATNPDGIQRYSSWANSNKSYLSNPDPASREHNEPWPGARSNHYWFDLNRDWIPLVHPESQARIKKLYEWNPNILIDEHEQGADASFHFSPGERSRVNPLISEENQVLTQKLASGYAKAFDKIGSFYFSGERYDDYYPGRGSTFPDLHGGVGLLFEQASVRGFVQESENGLITFPFAIRNQLTGSISTLLTASMLKDEFLKYQRNYFTTALDESKKDKLKAYVFGNEFDRTTTEGFASFLSDHQIKCYHLKDKVVQGNHTFSPTSAFVVPLDQPQYRFIKTQFELHLNSKDSSFYDISAWNMPQALNLSFESLNSCSGMLGEPFVAGLKQVGKLLGEGPAVAYLLKWDEYFAPRALSRLLQANLVVKVATRPVETLGGLRFDRGSILIPLGSINQDAEKVKNLISEIMREDGIDVYQLQTGDNQSVDLGSLYFSVVKNPKIAIITDDGVNSISAGQIWHLFDVRYKIPFTLLPSKSIQRTNLNRFNVIIMPSGSYSDWDEKVAEKIQNWLASGNTLIAYEEASKWLSKNKMVQIEFDKDENKALGYNYENALLYNASREIPGTVFETKLDLTHPLNFGYTSELLPVFKDNNLIQVKAENMAVNYPAWYSKTPLMDGYAPQRFTKTLAGTPALGVFGAKQGRIIVFYNSSNFRGYWSGTNRQLANSLFFGDKISLKPAAASE